MRAQKERQLAAEREKQAEIERAAAANKAEQAAPAPKPSQTIQGSNLNNPPATNTNTPKPKPAQTIQGSTLNNPPLPIPFPPRPADNMADPVNLEDIVTTPPSPPSPPSPPVVVAGSNPDEPEYDFPNPVSYDDDYDYGEYEYGYYTEIYEVYNGLETYYFNDNWTDYNYIYDYSNDLIRLYDYLTYADFHYGYNTSAWWDWYDFYAGHYYYQYAQIGELEREMSIEEFLLHKRNLIRNVLPDLPGRPRLDSIWMDTTFGPAHGGYCYYQRVLDFDPDNTFSQLNWALETGVRGQTREDAQALQWLFNNYGSSAFVNLLHWKVGKDLDSAITAQDKESGENYLFNAYYLATAVLLMEPQRNDFAELLGRITMTFRWYGIRLDGLSRK